MVAVPEEMPLTTPVLLTAQVEVLLLLHTPPPGELVKVIVVPRQREGLAGLTAPTTGSALTTRVAVAVATVQLVPDPSGSLVVTVKVTVFPKSPAAGVYVTLPLALRKVGLTEPTPFSVMLADVAPPPSVMV